MIAKTWPYAKIIAHRGGGKMAPENTILALQTGKKFGFSAVEFDVMLSSDQIPVIIHDDILERTTQSSLNGQSVSSITASELLQIDAGSWFDPTIIDVKIPSFESYLEFCITNNIWMNIEIKPAPGFDEITGEIVAAMTSKFFPVGSTQLPLFSSFSYPALLHAQRVAPHIPRAYLIECLDEVPDWREHARILEAVSINLDHTRLTPEHLHSIKNEENRFVFCYTVNSVDRARELRAMGVDSFCTDRLDLFQGLEDTI